jgi:hypothetical protein
LGHTVIQANRYTRVEPAIKGIREGRDEVLGRDRGSEAARACGRSGVRASQTGASLRHHGRVAVGLTCLSIDLTASRALISAPRGAVRHLELIVARINRPGGKVTAMCYPDR